MAKKKSTEMAKYDAELAKAAEEAAGQEANTGGGSFFSTKNGKLTLNDNQLSDNEMAVVILDAVMENSYPPYDLKDPQPPTCFAFGRSDETIAPHKDAPEPESDSCEECKFNAWGSADKGKGKACRNKRRLALIGAGTLKDGEFEPFTELANFEKEEITYLTLPPTSLKGFGAYVKQLSATLKRPPYAVYTRVSVEPFDTYYKVHFEMLDSAPNAVIQTLMERHKEARREIDFVVKRAEEAPKKRGGKKKASKRGKPKRRF